MYRQRRIALLATIVTLALFRQCIRAADVTVDQSFPASVRPNYQLLASHVWSLVRDRFGPPPPLDLPIIVHLGLGPFPKTRLVDDRFQEDWTRPKNILIELAMKEVMELFYAQFVYQLGHELGHVMLNPRRTNGTIESIATGLSYEVLDSMADQVRSGVPTGIGASLVQFAPNVRIYRESDEKSRLSGFPRDVQVAVERGRWGDVTRYLRGHKSELDQLEKAVRDSTHSRDIDSLCAIVLRSRRIPWRDLINLAACTSPSTERDPQFQALPLQRSCVSRLSGTLSRIGVTSR